MVMQPLNHSLQPEAKVYFLGKPGEDLTKQTEELKAINPDYDFASNTIDLCDYKAAQALYAEIEEKWGRLDVLVNNAGVDSSLPIHKMKQSQWDYVMNVNLKGMFNLTKYAIKYLKKTKGCIVNTASVAGIYGAGCGSPYPASKGGVIAFTKSMAWEQAYAGIRCNAVAPGVIDTNLLATVPPFAKKEPCKTDSSWIYWSTTGNCKCDPVPVFKRSTVYHRCYTAGRRWICSTQHSRLSRIKPNMNLSRYTKETLL